MNTIIKGISIITATVAAIGFIYGSYWLAKTLSYSFFYKDMVRSTITEMVRPEALR